MDVFLDSVYFIIFIFCAILLISVIEGLEEDGELIYSFNLMEIFHYVKF